MKKNSITVLMMGLLLFLASTPAQAELNFSFGQVFGTGLRASTIASGDLNDDGLPDLAVANIYSDSITVAYNTGGGRFDDLEEISLSPRTSNYHPVAVNIGDLNGDDQNEIVVALGDITNNDAGEIISLFKQDDGTFQTKNNIIDGIPSWVEVGDMNNDDQNDIVVGNNGLFVFRPDFVGQAEGGIYPFINIGNQNFIPTTPQTVDGSVVHFEFWDYNDDSFNDVIGVDQGAIGIDGLTGGITIEDPKLEIFEGNPTGVTYVEDKSIRLSQKPWSVDRADFDQDGIDDIAIALVGEMDEINFLGTGASVEIFRNTGESFVLFNIIDIPGVAFFVMAEDFDMDGDVDIAVTVQEIEETPDGNLLIPSLKLYENMGDNQFEEVASLQLQEEPRYAVKDDLDNDGDMDIAVICSIIEVGGASSAVNGQAYVFINEAVTTGINGWELY